MKDNILRGKLLDLLKSFYPDGVELSSILGILFEYHKSVDIASSLEYLTDKEYIIRNTKPHDYIENAKFTWYKISPKGIDLMEGNIDNDPGILIPKG